MVDNKIPADYWVTFTVGPADTEDAADNTFMTGRRVSFREYGTWMSDEQIDNLCAQQAERLAKRMKEARDAEMARARQAAEPFWKRWLGA